VPRRPDSSLMAATRPSRKFAGARYTPPWTPTSPTSRSFASCSLC
jgi:hypothetical protein